MDNKRVVIEIDTMEVRGMETAVKGVLAAVFYGICSVSSAFMSKALMDTMKFDFPVFIMVAQMIFTISTLELLSILGVIDLPAYTIKRGLSFLAPAVFYGINSVLALTALSHMNIAMYGVLKRCVPLFTMFFSLIILKKNLPNRFTMASVVLLTIGCVIAGFGDLGFSLTAYICGIGSNFTQALYLLLVQKYSEHHLSVTEILQLNSFNTLPLLMVAAIFNGEIGDLSNYPHWQDVHFFILFGSAISVGMLLNYSLFLCTSLTSALTTSVVGGFKALAQTLLGLFTFGGVSHNLATYTGISLNLIGGIAYIWARYTENKANHSGLPGLKKILSYTCLVNAAQDQHHDGAVHIDQTTEAAKHRNKLGSENCKS
jgi:solute carrier family 35 protein